MPAETRSCEPAETGFLNRRVVRISSDSPGALPHLALAERGFRGPVCSCHAVINAELRGVGGAAVDGVIAPTGPMVVAEQLPDSNPIKAEPLHFRAFYEMGNGAWKLIP